MFKQILLIMLLSIVGMTAKAQYLRYQPNALIYPDPVPPPTVPQYLILPPMHKLQQPNDVKPTIKIMSEYIIKTAKINGQDYSQHYINDKTVIAFFSISDRTVPLMAIVKPTNDEKSYGEMLAITSNETPQTQTSYGKTTMLFSWNYSNSYDDKTGTATVTFIKEYKPEGNVFSCHISLTNGGVIEFTGMQ